MNKTIAKVGYAPLTEEDGQYTYKNIIWFPSTEAGGREISAEPEGESTTIYADGLPVITAENNAGYNINLQLISIIDDIETDLLGNIKTVDGSIVEKSDTEERPRFALVVAKERFRGNTTYEIDTYYNCIISERPSRNDKTSEGNFDPNFPEFKIKSAPRVDNKVVRQTQYLSTLPTKIAEPDLKSAMLAAKSTTPVATKATKATAKEE